MTLSGSFWEPPILPTTNRGRKKDMSENIYLPHLATVKKIEPQTPDTVLISIVLDNSEVGKQFNYLPGQFAELSVFGVGECPISFTSTPTREGSIEFCVRGVGETTRTLASLYEGDKIGIRGPFGNSFPLEQIKGKNILVVAGGIGLAPLRSLINYILDKRDEYGKMEILYGARRPIDLCFKEELNLWNTYKDVSIYLTVDNGDEKWKSHVGFVPQFLEELNLLPKNKVAFTCGPPIMIKLVIDILQKKGYQDNQIITTLEMKMKCGVGKCGRCNIGDKYVCQDGPVFTLEELRKIKYGE